MIHALVLAAVTALTPAPQTLKSIRFDDFTVAPYTLVLSGENSQSHNWHNLDKQHVKFGDRLTNLQINNNPNQTALTLTIGNGVLRLASPLQVAWHFHIQWGNDGVVELDLSNVEKFVADLSTVPDQVSVLVVDRNGTVGSNGFELGRIGGIYFRKADFLGSPDWKHIKTVDFKQDFNSLPNPLSYTLSSFYATVLPVSISPAALE